MVTLIYCNLWTGNTLTRCSSPANQRAM